MPADEHEPPSPGSRQRFSLKRYGEPVEHYIYRSANGEELIHVCRYQAPTDAPSSFEDGLITRYESAFSEWKMTPKVPTPIILYNLDLITKSAGRIFILPDEKSANSFNRLQTQDVGTTWLGGPPCAKATELRPILLRQIVVIPRYTESSLKACGWLAATLHKAGCEVSFLHPKSASLPTGWGPESIDSMESLDALMVHASPVTLAAPKPAPKQPNVAMLPSESAFTEGLPMVERWARWNFQRKSTGHPYENLVNIQRYLEAHPGEYGDVWMDLYRKQIRYTDEQDGFDHEWQDEDDIELQGVLQTDAALHTIHKSIIRDAIISHAFKRPKHTYREWLKSLEWDGEERVDSALVYGWGTPDDEYHRAASRTLFLQQAARILKPGCKADLMFILEGDSGIGKSHSLSVMFGDENVVVPKARFGNKDFYQEILGKTVVEIADLGNFKGAELEIIKRDITTTSDRFRPPYGRMPAEFPRQCVFIGTTEGSDWNEDPMITARRFPPVECLKIDLEWIAEYRLQVLAEARYLIENGEKWYGFLPEEITRDKQTQRVKEDSWERNIIAYLQSRNRVTVADIIGDALRIEDMSKWDMRFNLRISKVLRKMGWIRKTNGKERFWVNRASLLTTDPDF